VAVPVCVYYAAHGKLGRFFELYLLVPQAVAAGYSNTHFDNRVWAPLFYALPVLLGVLLIAALVETRPLRIATRWPVRRVVLVSALLAAVVSHLGALTRSDAPHLKNTMLALPAALCLAAFYLPGLLGARGRARWIGGLAIGAVVLAFLPMTVRSFEPALIPQKLWRPLTSRVNPPDPKPLPSGVPKNSIAASRIGKATFRRGPCCNSTDAVPMGQFARFLDRLHALVGSRRVFVDSSPGVVPPAVYFLADLRPATLPQDYGTMVINGDIRRQWFRYFRRHLGQIDAVVSTKPGRRGPRLWAARFPSHRTVTMPVGQKTVTVYLR
jgi:hypothetical protein